MDIISAVILGLVQGLSEFIPISSTAHLTLAGKMLGVIDASHPEKWTSFIAVVQLGTLAAVLAFFKQDIIEISKAYFSENIGKNRKKYKDQSQNAKMGLMITIGTLPIVVIGLALKDFIEGSFTKELQVIGISLIALAVVLFIAEKTAKFKRDMSQSTMKDAVIVGFAQCLALIPGASRSGTTLTAGLFLGLKRDSAAKFSFLLSIPAILASGLLEFYQSLEYINSQDALAIAAAAIVAAISGYASIALLLKFLKTRSTLVFVVYRILAGAAILMFFV